MPSRFIGLLLLIAASSVAAVETIVAKPREEGRSGRQLRGCPYNFITPLYQPTLAYNRVGMSGPQLQLPSQGWYDLGMVALGGSWDKAIQSIVVGGGTMLMLWDEVLNPDRPKGHPEYFKPPTVIGEGSYRSLPDGLGGKVSTILALQYASKEPSFATNLANLINGLRQGYGIDAKVKYNDKLTSAADGQAVYMFKQKKLTHDGPAGAKTLKDRLIKAGYGAHKEAVQLMLTVKAPGNHWDVFNILTAKKYELTYLLRDYTDVGTGWSWNGDKGQSIYLCIVLAKK